MSKVIDLSKYNTVSDFGAVASNVDEVIIRAGYRGYGSGKVVQDAKFVEFALACKEKGIPFGIYFMSQAINVAEAEAEAQFVATFADQYGATLPLFIDSEDGDGTPRVVRADGLSKEDRTEVVKAKGKADVVLCTPELFSIILEASGSEFTPEINNYMNATGQVGKWLGFTFVECTGLAEGTYAPEYYDYSGTKQTVAIEDLAKVDFIMYNHEAFSIVPNFEVARIVDSENFAGSKAQVEMNCGYRVTSAAQVLVRSHA